MKGGMKTELKVLKEGETGYGLMGECAKTQVDCTAGDSGSQGRVWGGSDAQWWDDFCQSNLSQMLILSLSTSTPLHKREMMVMLMKVELRFTVYLKREEGVRIHSVLFKLHLHLH